MADEFHDDWEVVPFDLNKKPKEDPDAYALVPANTERQLAAMPSRQRNSDPILPCSTSSHRTAAAPASQGTVSQEGGHHQGASWH